MDFWQIIYVIDWLIFSIVGLTVLYLAFFAFTGLFSRHPVIPRARKQNSFIVLIPATQSDKVVTETIMSVLAQSYPQRLFDIIVISDRQSETLRIPQKHVSFNMPLTTCHNSRYTTLSLSSMQVPLLIKNSFRK